MLILQYIGKNNFCVSRGAKGVTDVNKEEMAGRLEETKQRDNSAEYNALVAMTEDLCNSLPISDHDLLPRMVANRVISFEEKIEIRNIPTDRGKIQLFLLKLTEEVAKGENERFYKFLNTMKKSPKCSFLVERMERWISHYKQSSSVNMDASIGTYTVYHVHIYIV